MIIKMETGLETFETWSGATYTKEEIVNAGKANDFDYMIEELYPDGLTETELNDILWFDRDWIFESLGISEEDEN